MTAPWLAVVLLPFAAAAAAGQGADDENTRLALAAERFERESRVLTLFDRDGNVTGTVGERDIYFTPALSPDGQRIAVVISDPFEQKNDVWIVDIETGERTAITANGHWDSEWAGPVVWSPDGTELAYVGMRDGYEGVYRRSADGNGDEELVYRHPGANLWLGDWSPDGRYISMSTTNLVESYVYVIPLDGSGDIRELLHAKTRLMAGSFSPDGRFLSYRSEETGINEIYLWDLDTDEVAWQVSEGGALFQFRGPWNPEHDEIYYLATGETVTAARVGGVEEHVERTPLFDLSPAIRPGPIHTSVSRDGERLLVAVPHAPTLEQVTVFDRDGQVVKYLGEPGVYRNPTLSPDGDEVAVRAWQPKTNRWDIRTFNLETEAATAVTDDQHLDNWPVWSPDGSELAYASQRDEFARIFRKSLDGNSGATEVYAYEPGAFMTLTDWSADGRFLSFNDGCWGVLYIVPLDEDAADRRAMEWLRDEYQVAQARFSPDTRYIAYLSDEAEYDVFNLYIAPFDPRQPDGRVDGAVPLRVSTDNVLGMITWRGDGKELYYLAKDWKVMAVDVGNEDGLETGEPRVLFELPGPLPGQPRQWKSVSSDGERFVFVLNVPVRID